MLSLKKTKKEIIMEIKNKYSLKEDSFFPKKKITKYFYEKIRMEIK